MPHEYNVKLTYEQYLVLKDIVSKFEQSIEEDKKYQSECDAREQETFYDESSGDVNV